MVKQARNVIADAISVRRLNRPEQVKVPKAEIDMAFRMAGYGEQAQKKWMDVLVRYGAIKYGRTLDGEHFLIIDVERLLRY